MKYFIYTTIQPLVCVNQTSDLHRKGFTFSEVNPFLKDLEKGNKKAGIFNLHNLNIPLSSLITLKNTQSQTSDICLHVIKTTLLTEAITDQVWRYRQHYTGSFGLSATQIPAISRCGSMLDFTVCITEMTGLIKSQTISKEIPSPRTSYPHWHHP